MKLRGVEFGHVFNASGARGFFREGYWFHPLFGLNYKNSTFVSKTITFQPRAGNMPLKANGQPLAMKPDCIVIDFRKGLVLNAVGLSNMGLMAFLAQWKPSDTPSVISLMSVAPTPQERVLEFKAMFNLLKPRIDGRTALQINLSCPNAGLNTDHLLDEAERILDAAGKLQSAMMVKLNALVSPRQATRISAHPACDAIVVSNTIPWGRLDKRIDWLGLFGSKDSPLTKYGGGGLSGAPIFPIVSDWIALARAHGLVKPIVGCGGVLSQQDAGELIDAGASAIELGSVSILRPWRVAGIIDYVNTRMSDDHS